MDAVTRILRRMSCRVPLLGLVLALAGCSQPDPAKLAVEHLLSRQQADGLFRYEFDFIKGRWSGRNNLVRQAGAAYALGEYLLQHDDPQVREALQTSLRAFSAASIDWGDGRLLTMQGDLGKAKAGATALALIAGLWYRQVTGDPGFDADLFAWRTGLLALRNPDGLFFSRPGSTAESPYSNGETWLALALHAETFPDDAEVAALLPELDRAVLERYGKTTDIGFFHWGQMATAARYRATLDPALVDFAYGQAKDFLTELRPQVNPNANSCYAVEGLAAALGVLRQANRSRRLQEMLEMRIGAEMNKNLELLIPSGARYVSLGEGRRLHAPEVERFGGAFLNGLNRPQARIDSTQHCLSALLKQRVSG